MARFVYAQPTDHDAAGNLQYDGLRKYTYDAWNRLFRVERAFRDSSGVLQSGSTVATLGYDGLGRRIQKKVEVSGDWNATHRYNFDGWKLVEERNASKCVTAQCVWGLTYIDELAQIGLNSNPAADNTCDGFRWPVYDANYNVVGLFACEYPGGSTTYLERYEYTPYGQRQEDVTSHGST